MSFIARVKWSLRKSSLARVINGFCDREWSRRSRFDAVTRTHTARDSGGLYSREYEIRFDARGTRMMCMIAIHKWGLKQERDANFTLTNKFSFSDIRMIRGLSNRLRPYSRRDSVGLSFKTRSLRDIGNLKTRV